MLFFFVYIGPIHFSYIPYFSAYFFNWNNVFLSQQISRNSVSTCFFSKANGANELRLVSGKTCQTLKKEKIRVQVILN